MKLIAGNRSGYTLGFFTFASDRVRPAPIMIAPGRLQAKNENPEYIAIDGKSLPINYFENDTHKMNEFLYKEYLEKAFVPNLPSMPDDRDQDSLVKGLVVAALLMINMEVTTQSLLTRSYKQKVFFIRSFPTEPPQHAQCLAPTHVILPVLVTAARTSHCP